MSEYEDSLFARIAECLVWDSDDVRTFSLPALRDLVRTRGDSTLLNEIDLVIEQGLHLTSPIRDPRRVPMPDMSWLGPIPEPSPEALRARAARKKR